MIDVRTKKPVQLLRGGESTAMFHVPVQQLSAVQALFDQNKVNSWLTGVDAALSDGFTIHGVVLSRNENHDRVQELLDSVR